VLSPTVQAAGIEEEAKGRRAIDCGVEQVTGDVPANLTSDGAGFDVRQRMARKIMSRDPFSLIANENSSISAWRCPAPAIWSSSPAFRRSPAAVGIAAVESGPMMAGRTLGAGDAELSAVG